MSSTDNPVERTEADIQAELESLRLQMTQTVDELFGRVQPAYLVSQAKQNAQDTIAELSEKTREKAQEFKTLAAQTAKDAREGDVEALKKVGYAAAGAVAVTVLVIWRIARRKR